MLSIAAKALVDLFQDEFRKYREQDWVEGWRRDYLDRVTLVRGADRTTWRDPGFQAMLWDDAAISSIGPGQSVTLVEAYADRELADLLFDARGSLESLTADQRGVRLQALFDDVLSRVHPRYARRRPRARLVRLLAALFPEDMTCLMDARRTWAVQRFLGAARLPGDFVAQHAMIRAQLRATLGDPASLEEHVDHSVFTWFLWQSRLDRPDEGAIAVEPATRQANAVPPFSLLPANAQRRGLPSVKDNVPLLVAMLREAEQGIGREDLVSVILSEAQQLNAASAANMISQAMGGLGLLRLENGAYRPTERGHDLLTSDDPAQVLRGPLVGRVFGMGHLLLLVRARPGELRTVDAAKALQDLVPTWKSTQPGSYIVSWARTVGLVQLEDASGGGRLILTEEGEDYAAALPDDFERRWRIAAATGVEAGGGLGEDEGRPEAAAPLSGYDAMSIVGEGCFLPPEAVEAAVRLLRRRRNVVLQGPPGTGKTWLAKRLGWAVIGARDPERLVAVQFQPSLSYEDFVRGWRPDGAGGLRLADGVFLDAVEAARAEPDRPFVLVIEEINRGNPAQILGELLTLIEESKRRPEEALRLAYPRHVDERVWVPDNLFIVGTMNVADRSLALVDLALRRRFAFIDLAPALGAPWRSWCAALGAPADFLAEVEARITALNEAIAADRSLGPQFRVGHSFVTPTAPPGPDAAAWRAWFAETVYTAVAPLLREYWYDDLAVADVEIAKLAMPG